MYVCRVFALSQYLCTASEQRTHHLVTFLDVCQLVEKSFFDKLRAVKNLRFLQLFFYAAVTSVVSSFVAAVVSVSEVSSVFSGSVVTSVVSGSEDSLCFVS